MFNSRHFFRIQSSCYKVIFQGFHENPENFRDYTNSLKKFRSFMKSLKGAGISGNPWFHIFPVTYTRINVALILPEYQPIFCLRNIPQWVMCFHELETFERITQLVIDAKILHCLFVCIILAHTVLYVTEYIIKKCQYMR